MRARALPFLFLAFLTGCTIANPNYTGAQPFDLGEAPPNEAGELDDLRRDVAELRNEIGDLQRLLDSMPDAPPDLEPLELPDLSPGEDLEPLEELPDLSPGEDLEPLLDMSRSPDMAQCVCKLKQGVCCACATGTGTIARCSNPVAGVICIPKGQGNCP